MRDNFHLEYAMSTGHLMIKFGSAPGGRHWGELKREISYVPGPYE